MENKRQNSDKVVESNHKQVLRQSIFYWRELELMLIDKDVGLRTAALR